MRTFLATMALALSFSLSASHLITGYMYYDYVSTNGNQITYDVYLDLYGDANGISMPATAGIYYKELNGTAAAQSVSASQFGSSTAISGNCGSSYSVNVYTYKTTITLTKNKSYSFAFSSCCRPPTIANIANPSSQGSYIGMILVTGKADVRPYNNSVDFQPEVNTAYVGSTAAYEICSADPDNDSLGFAIVPPKGGAASSLTSSNLTYATGYTNAKPLGTGSSVSIDTNNRMLVVNSNIQQNAVVNVRIVEYAKDTTGTYKIMSVIFKEMIINVIASSSTPPSSIEFSGAAGNYASDTITVTTSQPIYPHQANFDSTQLILVDPNGLSTNYVLGFSSLTATYNAFIFSLSDSLSPGLWTLIGALNTDSMALRGSCNKPLIDTINFFVTPPPPVLVGPSDSIYAPANTTYTMTNYQYVDSISYALSNATLISSAPDFSSFEIQWGPANGPAAFTVYAYNGGIADTAAIDVTIHGIGINELDGSVVLYPNPIEDFIYLRGAPANTTFELRNTTGQLLRSGTLTERIDLRGVASGTLLLTLKNQHSIKQYKLVKR
ncbi:T9SS type A sorting domain-containing protein [Schleiferiaceae bacterium]|nr:T9SS type A sorting domain-containing protein [Schleiferiaceae bacterium]